MVYPLYEYECVLSEYLSCKAFLAISTLIRFVICMNPHVCLSDSTSVKSISDNVHTDMVYHLYESVSVLSVYPFRESISDNVHTDKVFPLYESVCDLSGTILCKAFLTIFTLVRFILCMSPNVSCQVTLL